MEGEPAEGKFTGILPKGTSDNYYAVVNYPDGVAVNPTTGNLELTIRQNKAAWANNIPSNGIPLVANVQNGSAQFKHIFGLLKVNLSATESFSLKKIAIHDLAGYMLWGQCIVPVNEKGELDCENITMTGGDNTITMTLKNAKEIGTTVISYYFPVPMGALEGGFSIVLYEADDTKTDGIGRAYTFMQKITGTKAMPRAGILEVNAPVTAKPEAYEANGRGYYKSLFVNAGVGLDAFRHKDDSRPDADIPAIEYMGLHEDFEYINLSNKETQNGVIIGNDKDANGVLLYPDGSPRFRLIFNRGGSSVTHGQSLGSEGRSRFKNFFDNGGSYSGVCAGAFLAAHDVSSAQPADKPFTYDLIPVALTHTRLPYPMDKYRGIYTNMEILSNAGTIISGLNGDNKFDLLTGSIADVMHHGGGYLPNEQASVSGVETLMKYRYSETTGTSEVIDDPKYPDDTFTDAQHYYTYGNRTLGLFGNQDRDGEYSTWAYKNPNGKSGRAVCTGSHPEVPGKDSDKQFTGFMFRYAMEGNGDAVVKSGDLVFGQTRYMNQSPTSYETPADNDAGIGDGQYHHFKFISSGIDNFVLRLDSEYDKNSGIDLYLGLRQQKSTDGKIDFAWLSESDYTLCNKGGQKEIRIKHLPEGDWYVSVYCATKVTAEPSGTGLVYYKYTGQTQVLNGVPYSIKIVANGYIDEYASAPFGDDGDDFSNTMDD